MKFLSSFRFAIVLIFLSAVFVIAGTILESRHGSHRMAEDWIYRNPVFQALLLGYFVNILLSALSRYPFKKRHIPFLMTHLGLLMIISGVFIKTQWGVQGHMQLIEGSISDDLIHPHKPALYVENRWGDSKSIPIESVKVLEYHPHAEELYQFGNITIPPDKLKEWIAYDKGFGGYSVQQAAAEYWIAELWDEDHFLENLEKKGWPLLESLRAISDKEKQIETWMNQIYAVQDLLPEVETPLSHVIVPKPAPIKPEDARPAIVLDKKISLVYDPHKTGLKWPSSDGRYLFKFQPHTEKLPYRVRVHRASDIKHPGSDQTASYECILSINEKPCMLQMNHVHETEDGYRFYLAGMGTIDSYGVRSVQLVVNRDPAKMILTYPGALLVALGIISLFFGKKI